MYRKILRPLLFLIAPETIHHLTVGGMKAMGWLPGGRWFLRVLFKVKDKNLEREVFGLRFPNPVGFAAGFDKNAEVYNELAAMGFGFIEIGTVTPKGQPGNPKPRLFRLEGDQALINRMGFNNKGMDEVLENLKHKKGDFIVGGNLGKNTATSNDDAAADYLKSFRRLYDVVDYFVINVSCPNVVNLRGLQDKDHLRTILTGLLEFRRGQEEYRPILLKISPDLDFGQIDETIGVVNELKLDGVVATNTTTSREGLAADPETVDSIGNGGLSGEPLTGRAIEVVRYIHDITQGNLPIIGVGGIMSVEDALAMLDAGASLIQVYTGYIYNGPAFVKKICRSIAARGQA